MRANSSDPQDTVTAEHPIKPERLRLLDRLSKYRQPIGLAVTLLLFAIALIACRHLLAELDLDALHDSILDVPKPALIGAFGCDRGRLHYSARLRMVGQSLCRRDLAAAHIGAGRIHRVCDWQCHRSVAAVRRLGSLPFICTTGSGGVGSRAHDLVRQSVAGLRPAAAGCTGDAE